jgi:hypothetical protein
LATSLRRTTLTRCSVRARWLLLVVILLMLACHRSPSTEHLPALAIAESDPRGIAVDDASVHVNHIRWYGKMTK